MPQVASIEQLLQAGAHFGHLTRRWNPKMREFIFMERNGIHILDLKKTQKHLQETMDAIAEVVRSGKKVLFIGTKKQAQEIVKAESDRCGQPYVTHRWLGGMLTNFQTVRKSIARMEEIMTMQADGTYESITKKERLMLDRELAKLSRVMAGISKMNRLPGAIFVVDIVKEDIAVQEAMRLNIPIFAMVDTNADPDVPDYIIPCNDDSARAIQLIASQIADVIIEASAERETMAEEVTADDIAEKEDDAAPKTEDGQRRRRRRRSEEVA